MIRILLLITLTACTSATHREQAVSRVDLGTAYLRESNPQSAIVVLKQAVKYDRKNWDAWNKLGLAYMAQEANDQAEDAFKHALRIEPGKAEPNNSYGLLLTSMGRYDEAIERFQTASQDITYRKPGLVLTNLGFALLQAGLTDRAIETLDQAIKRTPNLCQARFHRGRAWQVKGEAQKALDDLDAVIALCPEELPGAYYHGAQALLTLGDTNAACTNLRTILREHPVTDLADMASTLYTEQCQ